MNREEMDEVRLGLTHITIMAVACGALLVVAAILSGCTSFDWDRTASGGDRMSFGIMSCPPAYESDTELTPMPGAEP